MTAGDPFVEQIQPLTELGWKLYPFHSHSKHACFKAPSSYATDSLSQLRRWHHQFDSPSWRVVTEPSGLVVLDLDVPLPVEFRSSDGTRHKHDGVAAMRDLVRTHGELPRRPTCRTGGGGLSLWFRAPGVRVSGKSLPPGVDLLTGRSAAAVPPSRHHTLPRNYLWAIAPWECPAPELPNWLLWLVEAPPGPPRPVWAAPGPEDAQRGQRILQVATTKLLAMPARHNDGLNSLAYWVVWAAVKPGALSEGEAWDALYAAARQTGMADQRARDTLKSAFDAGWRHG